MTKHWEYTEYVSEDVYYEYSKLGVPIVPSASISYNTAVYVQDEAGNNKRLEGIFDPQLKSIRQLKDKTAPNRELRLYKDALMTKEITVLAVNGLMGTGKTKTVVEHLIDTHLANVRISERTMDDPAWKLPKDAHKIMIAKPTVNAGEEDYGFLPGDKDEKLEPLLRNYTQYFDRMHQSGFKLLKAAEYVEILPLGFIRGLDSENIDIVVDECQNTKELVTMVTRNANNSRIFLLGDTSVFQIDLQGNTPKKNGLTDIIDLLQGAPYFQYIEMKTLEHIVRSGTVRDVVRRLFKKHGEDPQEWTI